MATVNKDFKIKSGLIVEGTTATVNGYDILTKKPADDQYIIDLIGGETLVKSVSAQFDVSAGGELSLDRTVVDAYYDAAGSASDAQDAAESFATAADTALYGTVTTDIATAKTAAEATAQGYANDAEAAAIAHADALTTTDIAEGTSLYFTNQRALDATSAAYDIAGSAAAAQAAAEQHADDAVAALVDGAPALLDTLNELAAAIADNPNYATDVANLVAGKQDTLTPGSNIDITGSTISVTGLDSADISDFNSAAVTANTGLWDTIGAASAAQTAAEGYASGLDSATNTRIDNLDTDDVAEGTAQYFTDARAKTSAADLLTGANLTNITITGTGAGLTITAENGVADSTTSDLAEGSNLYFTDSRALDAVSGSNIQPESIDITWVRRENATWTDVPTASQVVCHQAGAGEGSMKYLVRVTAQVGGVRHSHVTELLATVDGSNGVALVEYGTIYTSVNPLATATVLWNGLTNCYELNVTTANNNSEVMVAATMLASID